MEEQILEILKKRMIYPDLQDRLKITLTLMSEDITSHVIEFIEWLNFGVHDFYRTSEVGRNVYANLKEKTVYEIDSIYQYWLNNVKHV